MAMFIATYEDEKSIYKNEQKIARNIEAFNAEGYKKDNKTYIQVSIEIGTEDEANYTKTTDYVLKYW